MKLILLGPPGAGKGTQAERLCARYHMAHISTGDMLRVQMREGTALGKKAKSFIEKGALVPDDVVIGMGEERIRAADCENGYLLDGFPRTVAQADALAAIADVDAVINLEVPFDVLTARISGRRVCANCGRAYHVTNYEGGDCSVCGGALYQRDDDREETVRSRLKVYQAQTAPLVDYYAKKGLLKNFDGGKSAQDVFADIIKVLG
ncbi:MAG: adenylate kinase [Clostridiales bacterium]|jgi:adenylate kinase|nr:adenylate kinase [Clostridiales bacterium]